MAAAQVRSVCRQSDLNDIRYWVAKSYLLSCARMYLNFRDLQGLLRWCKPSSHACDHLVQWHGWSVSTAVVIQAIYLVLHIFAYSAGMRKSSGNKISDKMCSIHSKAPPKVHKWLLNWMCDVPERPAYARCACQNNSTHAIVYLET